MPLALSIWHRNAKPQSLLYLQKEAGTILKPWQSKRFEVESSAEKETKTEYVWVCAGVLSRSWAEERRGANVWELMSEMPVSLVFLQSNSIKFCWATWLPCEGMGHETLLTVFVSGVISVFLRSYKPASWTECHSQMLFSLPLPPAWVYHTRLFRPCYCSVFSVWIW